LRTGTSGSVDISVFDRGEQFREEVAKLEEKKVSELRPGMRGVNVKVRIDSISEPRSVNLRTGGQAKVADAQVSDETGVIKLSLWDDQISMIEEGDMVVIENGYTHAYRGENNLNIGKYGKLQKI